LLVLVLVLVLVLSIQQFIFFPCHPGF